MFFRKNHNKIKLSDGTTICLHWTVQTGENPRKGYVQCANMTGCRKYFKEKDWIIWNEMRDIGRENRKKLFDLDRLLEAALKAMFVLLAATWIIWIGIKAGWW